MGFLAFFDSSFSRDSSSINWLSVFFIWLKFPSSIKYPLTPFSMILGTAFMSKESVGTLEDSASIRRSWAFLSHNQMWHLGHRRLLHYSKD